jgi:hypothetical protein
MRLYTLTTEEIAVIDTINAQRTNTLLVICQFGDYIGVDLDALQSPDYATYLAALGEYQETKIVDVQSSSMEIG